MNNGSTVSLRYVWVFILLAAISVGCTSQKFAGAKGGLISGESVVLVAEQPAQLAFVPKKSSGIVVRSTYLPGQTSTLVYEPGRDYAIDFDKREIRRLPGSRIPDFSTNMLFGVEDFDHSKYPGFGNTHYFAFIDYRAKRPEPWPQQAVQTAFLPKTLEKLKRGEAVKIVAYGDSITAGGDATHPDLIYWNRWAADLRKKYPQARIEIVNGATGGDSTRQGLDRLQEKVLKQDPDLVLVGFGMNDHNVGGYGTPLDVFSRNLGEIIDRIRRETGAEVIVLSTFPPNPQWRYGSKNMKAYADATQEVARSRECAYADIYNNWLFFETRKKPEDLLGNNINHPNDFGHWLYFAVLQQLGL